MVKNPWCFCCRFCDSEENISDLFCPLIVWRSSHLFSALLLFFFLGDFEEVLCLQFENYAPLQSEKEVFSQRCGFYVYTWSLLLFRALFCHVDGWQYVVYVFVPVIWIILVHRLSQLLLECQVGSIACRGFLQYVLVTWIFVLFLNSVPLSCH